MAGAWLRLAHQLSFAATTCYCSKRIQQISQYLLISNLT